MSSRKQQSCNEQVFIYDSVLISVCRSILKGPEKATFRSTAKKSDLGPPSRSRYTGDNKKTAASPPEISTFAYRPVKSVQSDQDRTTNKTKNPTDAYTPMLPTVCPPDRSKFTGTAMKIADGPPDLSSFAYKPTKGAVRYSAGSRF